MILVAVVVLVSSDIRDITPLTQAIVAAQRCVRIVQVGMVLLLLFFSRYLGVSRRQHSFGIALGFGCFALVELALVASWVGDHLGNLTVGLLNMVAYNLSLVIWLGYAWTKSPVRDVSVMLQPHRWEHSLSDIQHPVSPDSLIPMFEGMVDRALSRTQTAPAPLLDETNAATPLPRGGAIPMTRLNLPGVPERVGTKR
jgi:hypothetical protein